MKYLERYGRILTPKPNWQRPVVVSYVFRTGIITSYDGRSQRYAMRETARVQVSYDTIMKGMAFHRHTADLAESQHSRFFVAATWRQTKSTNPIPPGAMSVEVEEVPNWMVVGATLIISGSVAEEAVVIGAIEGLEVTFTAPVTAAQPVGAAVMLAYKARVAANADFRAETNGVWVGLVSLDVDPGSDPQPVPSGAGVSFEGREVLLARPNWQQRPSITLSELRDIVDSGRGIIEVESPTNRMERRLQWGFTGMDGESSDALIGFFLRMKGQRTAFWAPTWQDDFEIISATASSFTVKGQDAFFGYSGSDTHKVVLARWGSTHQTNRISNVTLQGNNTLFTFAASWSQAISTADLACWCFLSRFTTDSLAVSYETDKNITTNVNLMSVPYEAPV